MIRELHRGKADGLIIHKIDRSARNFADWAKIGDLADAGIDVHFATESLDFRSRGGRLTADIQAVIAADYIRNLREETIKGITGRLKQGLFPFKAPIGYVDNGGGRLKTLDPIRAPLVLQAFELYASRRYSLRTLLGELERRGLRNDRGHPITMHCLEQIFDNPFYCGIIRIKKTGAVYQGAHEPLVSAGLFEEVQKVKCGRCGKKVTRHNHTYRGLFRCAHCERSMIPELQKGRVYYRCQTRGCLTKTLREDKLEGAIRNTLSCVRLTDRDLDWISSEVHRWLNGRSDSSRLLSLTTQINQVTDKIESLTDALVDRLIDKAAFNERKATLALEKTRLEDAKANALKNMPDAKHVRKFLELIKDLACTYVLGNSAEKREIVELATSNRVVSGKSVYLEPANWLSEAELALAALNGDPDRDTSRTFGAKWDKQIEVLVDLCMSDEVAHVSAMAVAAEHNGALKNAARSRQVADFSRSGIL